MKKWQQNVLALMILTSLLSGCTLEQDNSYKEDYSDTYNNSSFDIVGKIPHKEDAIENTVPDVTEPTHVTNPSQNNVGQQIDSIYQKRELTPEETQIISSYFRIIGNTSAQNNIINYNVVYPYSELYKGELSIKGYNPSGGENIIENNRVNYQKLLTIVKNNNQQYMDRFNIKTYANTTNQFVELVCRHIEKQVNMYLSEGLIDVSIMNEKLSSLKVFSFSDYANGFYLSEKGILALNITNIYDETTIDHEIGHLIQSASVKELQANDYTNRFGFCYQYSDTKVNPTYWNWFFETAAEHLSMELNKTETPSYYTNGSMQLEGIKLANFSYDNNLERTLINGDVNAFYKWFNSSGLTKEEINNLFYANTILLNNSPGQEGINFYRTLLSEYNIQFNGTESRIFEEGLKGVIALTESKMFYNNLIQKLSGKTTSLEELFSVISVFELELSRQTWYQTKYSSLETFLEGYNYIQEEFFGVIAMSSGKSVDELKRLYYLYNENYSQENLNVSFLSSKENAYFNDIVASRKGNKKSAILKLYSDYYLNSQKTR